MMHADLRDAMAHVKSIMMLMCVMPSSRLMMRLANLSFMIHSVLPDAPDKENKETETKEKPGA